MALDSLPGDQRAVLQLVLARRRGYEEIAHMLSIPSDAVRDRALGALDALAGSSPLTTGERRLIGDYLLSQLPAEEETGARELLAHSPAARAWALALTPALEPVAADPLPRIPPPSAQAHPVVPIPPRPTAEPERTAAESERTAAEPVPSDVRLGTASAEPERAVSRRGGMVVIGLAAAVIVAAVVVLLVTGHHSRSRGALAAATRSGSTTSASSATRSSTTTQSTTSAVKYLAQINLKPVASSSKAIGAAVVLQQGTVRALEMFGQHIPANTKQNSYEVWLYSSPSHFETLGFVSPAVGHTGRFSVVTRLPSDAGGYRQLIVTTETARKPTHPGAVLLRGTITGLS